MVAKIDISGVVSRHLATLYDTRNGTTSISIGDLVLFFGIPAGIGFVAAWFGFNFQAGPIGVLVTAVAILAGLLFNLLVLAFDVSLQLRNEIRSAHPHNQELLKQRDVLTEAHSNISYAILAGIVIIILALVVSLITTEAPWLRVFDGLLLAFVINFVLTLVMVLKRIHVVMHLVTTRP